MIQYIYAWICIIEKRLAVVPAVLELAGLSATPPDCGSSTLRTHPALKCMYAVICLCGLLNILLEVYINSVYDDCSDCCVQRPSAGPCHVTSLHCICFHASHLGQVHTGIDMCCEDVCWRTVT